MGSPTKYMMIGPSPSCSGRYLCGFSGSNYIKLSVLWKYAICYSNTFFKGVMPLYVIPIAYTMNMWWIVVSC